VELTQHARLNTLDMGALCSFAVYGCTGPKIEVQETVDKNFYCAQQFLLPLKGAHMARAYLTYGIENDSGSRIRFNQSEYDKRQFTEM